MLRTIENFLDGVSREVVRRRLQRPSFTLDGWRRYSGAYEEAYRQGLSSNLLPAWETEVAVTAKRVKQRSIKGPRGVSERDWDEFSQALAVVLVHQTFGFRHSVDLWPQISDRLNEALPGIVNPDNPSSVRLPEHPRDFRSG